MGDVNITPAIFMSQDLFFGQIMLGQPRSHVYFLNMPRWENEPLTAELAGKCASRCVTVAPL